MENKNDIIEEKIKQAVGQEPVPESLHPDNVEKMLKQHKKKRSRSWGIGAGIAAAAAVAVVTTTVFMGFGGEEKLHRQADGKNETVLAGAKDGKNETVLAKAKDGKLPDGISQAESYEEVYKLLNKYYAESNAGAAKAGVLMEESVMLSDSAELAAPKSAENDTTASDSGSSKTEAVQENTSSSEGDYSTTNVRTEGVAEADIMLTDGTYLYRVYGECDKVEVVEPQTDGKELRLISTIEPEEELQIEEMYLSGTQLVVLGTQYPQGGIVYEYGDSANSFLSDSVQVKRTDSEEKVKTIAYTYDITDAAHPVLQGSLKMEGYYRDSRLVDGYLYLFTNYTDMYDCVTQYDAKSDAYIPCVQEEPLPAQDIYIPDIVQADGYLVGAGMKLSEPSQVTEQFAVLMDDGLYYVSGSNIYITSESYREDGITTKLNRFSYADGQMQAAASGEIKGSLNDSFSLDEYDNYLRLVATKTQEDADGEWTTSNALYILDDQLKEVSHIDGLAEGETIYSARFMGNVGYFVTYRQVDPLFSVDLTDPYKPQILGELKISGFSEYLHPYGDGRLLGIGWETTPNGWGGVTTDGLKLSMFNTNDPANVTEENRKVESQVVSSSVYNYKSILVNASKNLFGFAVVEGDNESYETHYRTYRYDETQGFSVVTDTSLGENWIYDSVRGIYIGSVLYVSDGYKVAAISLETGEKLAELNFE